MKKFESSPLLFDNDAVFLYARDIQFMLGYTEWRNFEGVIKRAIQLIVNMQSAGIIEITSKQVNIGSGATRKVIDYKIDEAGFVLIKKLSSSQKLNNSFEIRNETIFIQLIEKFCRNKNIFFQYQFSLFSYRYDCIVGDNILIEFDEPHHNTSPKQKQIDIKKNKIASDNKYLIFRINLNMDIIDVIIFIENNL